MGGVINGSVGILDHVSREKNLSSKILQSKIRFSKLILNNKIKLKFNIEPPSFEIGKNKLLFRFLQRHVPCTQQLDFLLTIVRVIIATLT